jgi:hypothetical protein
VASFEILSGTCLEGLRKTMKSLGEDSWCSGRHSNRLPVEHNSRCYRLNEFARWTHAIIVQKLHRRVHCLRCIQYTDDSGGGSTAASGGWVSWSWEVFLWSTHISPYSINRHQQL